MSANKYGSVLTIILVILIIGVLLGIGLLAYNYIIKPNNGKNKKIEAFEEFDRNAEETQEEEEPEEPEEPTNTIMPGDTSLNPSGKTKKKTYYKGFVMLGYITISKTNVKEPILDVVTPESLNTAVATLYPSNPQLNQPGNVVIIGHNYKNGQFFSNNKKLSTGDKIKIKDSTGKELTYKIYEIFETNEQDTSFYNRDTNGAIEITLSTCTDDSKARTIILARVE